MARTGPFWSRTKVGVSAGVLGIIIGSGFGTDESVDPPTAAEEAPAVVESPAGEDVDVAEAVEDATSDLEDQLVAADEAHAEELAVAARKAVKSERAAVKTAVAQAVAKAVAKTRAEEQAKAEAAQQQIQTFTSTPPADAGTDPHYGTCGEANDNGFGSYVRGQDPEYDWYDDRDGDGVVCEF